MPWDIVSLEQVGTTSIVGVLLYVNYGLRSDLRAERRYSQGQEKRNQELNTLYQDLAIRTIETMVKIEAGFIALKDKL